jgi:hypothetical protein
METAFFEALALSIEGVNDGYEESRVNGEI